MKVDPYTVNTYHQSQQGGNDMPQSNIIEACWTTAEVQALVRRQNDNTKPGYTCGNCGALLFPTERGWLCMDCRYTQSWCWRQDVEDYK